METLDTQCVIAGGGPAGLMTGYLLARQGVDVIVLEKHADFLRDFRGDTVHPSTLELIHELGFLERLLARPHQKTERVSVTINGQSFSIADFTQLNTHSKFIAMMPQWDFLDCLAKEARHYSNFRLLRSTTAEDLHIENGRVIGVRASRAGKQLNIRAALTIAADGRGSTLREASGLPVKDLGAPIDVFWMKLPRADETGVESLGRITQEGLIIQINRGSYWQCALPFPKGSAEAIRAQGLDAFRKRVADLAPSLSEVTGALQTWDDVKMLNVQVNHLKTWWRDGLLCIGDAAHAMSPVGGVGINLAVQDAVAAARMLGPHLLNGDVTGPHLAAVQKRRAWPARVTQSAQIMAHKSVLVPALNAKGPPNAPFIVKVLNRIASLRGVTARAMGVGLRPEHWPHSLRGD